MDAITYNLGAFIFIVGIILGIRLMNSPETAVKGNLLGSICILGAIVLTLISNGIVGHKVLWLAMAIGGLIGYLLAVRVEMIQMPQLIALFNGLGGGASAVVALVILFGDHDNLSVISKLASSLALTIGGLTLSGSLIAAGKLAQKVPQRPVFLKGHRVLSISTLTIAGLFALLTTAGPPSAGALIALLTFLIALFFGLIFTIRIGGADMPITISLLNSLSGLAAAIAGFAVNNLLLVAVGAIVGVAGLMLTRIMCRAMNRTLAEVLAGETVVRPEEQTVSIKGNQTAEVAVHQAAGTLQERESIASMLRTAKKIVIAPGYGMAVAQAQRQVKQLSDELENLDKEVTFAIHPVAGRMPGHMNVLLAEVEVPYEKLVEMDDINPEFRQTDVVIVVGANDVVNPAASTAEGTPIYGMPILRVNEAKHVIVCNKDHQPGYAGVDNPLYQQENVTLLLGDGKETVSELIKILHA